jgi:surfeit locus 1 family protein
VGAADAAPPMAKPRRAMIRRLLLPVVFGVLGTAVLAALGTWQLQRLHWKEAVIARIEARLAADPVPVPEGATPADHQYLRVQEDGWLEEGEVHVYTSVPPYGVGYRVIAPFEREDGRRILLDRGFVPAAAKDEGRTTGPLAVAGALHWPQETDRFTPAPDRERNIWFARDVPLVAEALGAEPILLVVEAYGPALADAPTPLPVTVNIPNNHLEYVLTWYGLALTWGGMSVYWVWRLSRRLDGAREGARRAA